MKISIQTVKTIIKDNKFKSNSNLLIPAPTEQKESSFLQPNKNGIIWNSCFLNAIFKGEKIQLFNFKSSKLCLNQTAILKNIQHQFVFCLNLKETISFTLSEGKKCRIGSFEILALYQSGKEIIMNLENENKHDFLIITILPSLFYSFLEKSNASDFSFFINNQNICHLGNFNLCDLETIKKLHNSKCEMETIGHIFLLLSSIVKQCEVENKVGNKDSFYAEEWEIENIHKITKAIQEDPSSFDSVQSISKRTGVCIPRLQQIFKRMFGVTVGAFIRESRLKEAEQLLQDKKKNITDIVHLTGFSSKSYFSKIFREKYHFSPSEYRKRILNYIKKKFH